MQEEFSPQLCRRAKSQIDEVLVDLPNLEESLARNGRTIPNRDLGAHRAALRRYGNRRNVEFECLIRFVNYSRTSQACLC